MVDDKTDSDVDVTLVSGRLFHFSVVDERSRALLATASVQASGPQRVEAEMPGKVVQVLVAVGDEVAAGAGRGDYRGHEDGKRDRFSRRWHSYRDQRRARSNRRTRPRTFRRRADRRRRVTRPVLLDTDIGSDVDDAIALVLLLGMADALNPGCGDYGWDGCGITGDDRLAAFGVRRPFLRLKSAPGHRCPRQAALL